jgi:hypothetical protein
VNSAASLFNPKQLTSVYLELANRVLERLPADIAARLAWSRNAFRHSSKNDMILFNAWDREQTGLERNQFNYCLNYKPLRPEDGHIWLLQVRCNVQRIAKVYPEVRDALRLELRNLKKARPSPFKYEENKQTVELRWVFDFDGPLAKFPRFLSSKFGALIEAAHPILISTIELFHRDAWAKGGSLEVGEIEPARRAVRKDLVVYSSARPSVPMQRKILERYNNRCAVCNVALSKSVIEYHHLKFKRDGGLRCVENFAPLHVKCHDELHRAADQNGNLPNGFLRKPILTVNA